MSHLQSNNCTVIIDLTTKNCVLSLAAISVDRFYAIAHPWRHRGAKIKRNIRILLAAIWIVALIASLPMMLLMAKTLNTFQGPRVQSRCFCRSNCCLHYTNGDHFTNFFGNHQTSLVPALFPTTVGGNKSNVVEISQTHHKNCFQRDHCLQRFLVALGNSSRLPINRRNSRNQRQHFCSHVYFGLSQR